MVGRVSALFLLLASPSCTYGQDPAPDLGCARQCTPETFLTDCTDPNGVTGAIPDPNGWPYAKCGTLSCEDGACKLVAWRATTECNYSSCGGVDSNCKGGPRAAEGLVGSCSYSNSLTPPFNQCVYRWCPAPAALPGPAATFISSCDDYDGDCGPGWYDKCKAVQDTCPDCAVTILDSYPCMFKCDHSCNSEFKSIVSEQKPSGERAIWQDDRYYYVKVRLSEDYYLFQPAFYTEYICCLDVRVFLGDESFTYEERLAGQLAPHWTKMCHGVVVGKGINERTYLLPQHCDTFLMPAYTSKYLYIGVKEVDSNWCKPPPATPNWASECNCFLRWNGTRAI